MFANTLTLTYKTVAYVLNRVNQDNYGSEYSFLDSVQMFTLKIRHSDESNSSPVMSRHNLLLEHVIYATPTTAEVVRTATLTLRAPKLSDPATLADLSDTFTDWANVGANALALAQGQN